jgi:hypothetical protein
MKRKWLLGSMVAFVVVMTAVVLLIAYDVGESINDFYFPQG